MRSSKKKEIEESSLPPKIPGNLEDLERTILLLGNRTKCELQGKARKELISLISNYPNPELAAIWKKEIKQIRKLLVARKEEQQANSIKN